MDDARGARTDPEPVQDELAVAGRRRECPVGAHVEVGTLLVVGLDDQAVLDRQIGERSVRRAVGYLQLRVESGRRCRDRTAAPTLISGRDRGQSHPRIGTATNAAGEPVAVGDGEPGRRRAGREEAETVLGVDDQPGVARIEAAALRLPAWVSSLGTGVSRPATGSATPTDDRSPVADTAPLRSSTPLPQSATSASASSRCTRGCPQRGREECSKPSAEPALRRQP